MAGIIDFIGPVKQERALTSLSAVDIVTGVQYIKYYLTPSGTQPDIWRLMPHAIKSGNTGWDSYYQLSIADTSWELRITKEFSIDIERQIVMEGVSHARISYGIDAPAGDVGYAKMKVTLKKNSDIIVYDESASQHALAGTTHIVEAVFPLVIPRTVFAKGDTFTVKIDLYGKVDSGNGMVAAIWDPTGYFDTWQGGTIEESSAFIYLPIIIWDK